MHPQNFRTVATKSGSEYDLASELRSRPFWHRFLEDQGSISKDFGMIFQTFWPTLGMFSAAPTRPQTPPLLIWFSFFLASSLANLPRESKNLPRTKPRTNPYRRLRETSELKASFFETPFLIATLLTPKTWAAVLPPGGLQFIYCCY